MWYYRGIMWSRRKLKEATVQESYWDCAREHSVLYPKISVSTSHKHIDHYWSEVYKICDKGSIEKYPQLFSLVKCVLSSEQHATERDFSISKIMLDAYGYCMEENTIDFFCLVKDELLRIGGVTKFNITADLILEVKGHITA